MLLRFNFSFTCHSRCASLEPIEALNQQSGLFRGRRTSRCCPFAWFDVVGSAFYLRIPFHTWLSHPFIQCLKWSMLPNMEIEIEDVCTNWPGDRVFTMVYYYSGMRLLFRSHTRCVCTRLRKQAHTCIEYTSTNRDRET